MKHCATCGRDVPDSKTVCDACEKWAAEHVVAAAPAPAPAASAPAKSTGLTGREAALFAIAIGVGGLITFALLSTRGVPSSGVAVAQAEAAKARPVPSASRPATPSMQTWSGERRAFWTGNQRNSVAFELPADNMVPIWLSQVRPLLVVRCMSKRTEVFVFTGSALKIEPQTEDHTVRFAFDDEQDTAVRWPDSAEHDALFAPDAPAFAARVMRAHSLRFGYTPHNASPVEARFHVDGLAGLLEPAARECGWTK